MMFHAVDDRLDAWGISPYDGRPTSGHGANFFAAGRVGFDPETGRPGYGER
jgi:hypothetical protein